MDAWLDVFVVGRKNKMSFCCAVCKEYEQKTHLQGRCKLTGSAIEDSTDPKGSCALGKPMQFADGTGDISRIEISSIKQSDFQMRDLDGTVISDLVLNIKERGLLQPIMVRRTDGEYEIVFGRHGKKNGYKGPETTVLLKDVLDVAAKRVVTDHIWFTLGKRLACLELKPGDIVRFEARVSQYVKGYRGHRSEDDFEGNYRPLQYDYRLSFPTKVQKLEPVPEGQQLTDFSD